MPGSSVPFYVPTPPSNDSSTRPANTSWVVTYVGNTSFTLARTAVANKNYTILSSDRYVAVTSLSQAITLTLPASTGYPNGALLIIADESGSASTTNTVTISVNGSDTINGASSFVINTAKGYLKLETNGSNGWTILGQSIASTFSSTLPVMNGTAATGSQNTPARIDHVHATDTSRAAKGANSDITSLSGLTTVLSVGQGGTGGGSATAARSSLGAAASGANTDITSLGGLTTVLSIAQGGSGSSGAAGSIMTLADGGCRLSVSGNTSLLLSPFNGGQVWVAGTYYTIPSGGLTLNASSLSANQLYYVYLYNASGTFSLYLSSSGYSRDAAGRAVCSTATYLRLVGMVYTNASSVFSDSATFRGCLNYFNRRALLSNSSGNNVGTASTSGFTALVAAQTFLTWADEAVTATIAASSNNNTAGQVNYTMLGIDGGAAAYAYSHTPTAGYVDNASVSGSFLLSEGMHTFTIGGYVSGGSGTWNNIIQSIVIRG